MKAGKLIYVRKKILSCFMAILLIILSCDNTWAAEPMALATGEEFTEDILKYKVIDEENKNVEVAGQNISASLLILTQLDIPASVTHDGVTYSVTRIGDSAFSECTKISRVNIPDGVTEIGTKAFYKSSLYLVNIPDSVTNIEDEAFYLCSRLSNVKIPESVERIGISAFEQCEKFTSIEIPEGVREIGESAFNQCWYVETISLPGSLEIIGQNAFGVCGNNADELTVIMSEGLKEIGNYAFSDCRKVKEITIPLSVETMGSYAFYECVALEKVIIKGRIDKIPGGGFQDCRSLKYIEIPDSVTTINGISFRNCISLESISIPASVKSFGLWETFGNCTSLKEMRIAVNVNVEDIKSVTPIIAGDKTSAFDGVATDRKLVFLNSDGTKELAGTSLVAAQQAYMADDDGNTTDNYWYGWEIGTVADLHTVTVDVKKDGEEWKNHGKQFLLKNENGYLIDDFQAENGNYTVCVKIGETVLDTGVTVKVEDSDTSVTIEYFTVTFQDGDTPYNDDTAWGKQIVREGEKVAMPTSNPEKTGYNFTGWKTDKEGNVAFDFEMGITTTTDIYAGWAENAEIPTTPSKPTEQPTGDSSEPTKPETPTANPNEPTKPETPTANPNEPTKPETPTANPNEPTKPETPTANPNEPTKPETPTANPNEPTKPETPTANPNEPAKPETPTANPNEPTKPEPPTVNPNEPTKPETPTANPNEPTNPETSTVAPSEPSANNPTNPDASEKPDEAVSETEEPSTDGIIDEAGEDEKPTTGDTTHIEIYATAAMIAGLSYVMLIFEKHKKGMSEEEKNTRVAALIEWAKKGSRVRKYVALTAICFLLLYYHSIGKQMDLEWKEICGN